MDEEIEEFDVNQVDVEFFEFKLLRKNTPSVRLSENVFDLSKTPSHSNLLVVSNLYGYFVAASNKDLRAKFVNSETSDELKINFDQKIHVDILEGCVISLRLSSDQLTIIVAIQGGIVLYYDVTKIGVEQSSIQPYQIMKFSDEIKDIRPNLGERFNIVAILLVSGIVHIYDYLKNEQIGIIDNIKLGDQVTALCWSPKGKQLVCGTQTGKLMQHLPEGIVKSSIQPPKQLIQPSYYDTPTFIVAYFPVVQDENSDLENYIVFCDSKKKTVYQHIKDLCPYSTDERNPNLYMETIRNWGPRSKNLVICANANSINVHVITCDESNEWLYWYLPEGSDASLPLGDDDNDTLPIGMAIDFTDTDTWITQTPSEDRVEIPSVPIVYILNNASDILAYRCFHRDAFESGFNCSDMITPQPLPTRDNVHISKYSVDANNQYLGDDSNTITIQAFKHLSLETRRSNDQADELIDETSNITSKLNDVYKNITQTEAHIKKDIQIIEKHEENQTCDSLKRLGSIGKNVKEKIEKSYQNTKETALALEVQESPLEYIDRSVSNISKCLYRNSSQMDYLIEQLDALTLQKTQSEKKIVKEPSSTSKKTSTHKNIEQIKSSYKLNDNLSYSDEAAKIATDYFNKEHAFNKLKDVNKFKRKNPVNNLFDPEMSLDIEDTITNKNIETLKEIKKSTTILGVVEEDAPRADEDEKDRKDEEDVVFEAALISSLSFAQPTSQPASSSALISSPFAQPTSQPASLSALISSPFAQPTSEPASSSALTSSPFTQSTSQPASSPALISSPFAQSTSQPASSSTLTSSPFSQSTSQPASSSVFGQSAFSQPAFGQPAFGQPAFGQPAFGQPAFGQPAFGQPAFGQPAFGQPAFGQPAFGQPGFGSSSLGLNTAPLKTPSSGGFARYTNAGGFGTANNNNNVLGGSFGTDNSSPGFVDLVLI
ncbi:4143_t:CDS:10 [Entrophospora sp. SA101]|nr:4143_t:CDS:10 [Entrophospora sp. SA101]